MTAEHLTILEPDDLRAIRIGCRKCKSSLAIRLNETIRVPDKCPACGEFWRARETQGAPTAAEALGQAIKEWKAVTQSNFMITFEVVQPS